MFARYTVGYSQAENELLEAVVTAKGLAIGTWVRMVSLEAARAEAQKVASKAPREPKAGR